GLLAGEKREGEERAVSGAEPPDWAFTSEHMWVEPESRASRPRQARSTSASISTWSSISPSSSASSRVINGAIGRRLWSVADGLFVSPADGLFVAPADGLFVSPADGLFVSPARGPFLGGGPHPLAHVLRGARGPADR